MKISERGGGVGADDWKGRRRVFFTGGNALTYFWAPLYMFMGSSPEKTRGLRTKKRCFVLNTIDLDALIRMLDPRGYGFPTHGIGNRESINRNNIFLK